MKVKSNRRSSSVIKNTTTRNFLSQRSSSDFFVESYAKIVTCFHSDLSDNVSNRFVALSLEAQPGSAEVALNDWIVINSQLCAIKLKSSIKVIRHRYEER